MCSHRLRADPLHVLAGAPTIPNVDCRRTFLLCGKRVPPVRCERQNGCFVFLAERCASYCKSIENALSSSSTSGRPHINVPSNHREVRRRAGGPPLEKKVGVRDYMSNRSNKRDHACSELASGRQSTDRLSSLYAFLVDSFLCVPAR